MSRARVGVTWGGVSVLVLCFAFSYGNVTEFALGEGLPWWLAVLLAPTLDITVLALLGGLRSLALAGISGRRLLPARAFLLGAGGGTWALNTARAWAARDYAKVALDSLAPALLVCWAEVLPWLLRLFREVERGGVQDDTDTSTDTSAAADAGQSKAAQARAFALAELAAGRQVTGPQLDARYGLSAGYGGRVLRGLTSNNGHRGTAAEEASA
jgi:hypothetical protein